MIRVSLIYAISPGSRFDLACFCNRHLPFLRERLGEACRSIALERGLAGADDEDDGIPGGAITTVHLYFDSEDSFRQAMAPHADDVLADLLECTDIMPSIRIGESEI